MTHYAYIHARPDTTDASGVFYVGKGAKRRFLPSIRRNRHHSNIVHKYGAENILVGKLDCSDESTAHDLERGLIKCLRRMDVNLVNLTDGGEGSSGVIIGEEQRANMRAASQRNWQNPEYRAKVVAAQTAAQQNPALFTAKKRAAVLRTAEYARSRLSDPAVKEVARTKNSEKSKAVWADPEYKARLRATHAARWSADMREAKAADMKGRRVVNNGARERKVKPEDMDGYILCGWVVGCLPRKKRK